MIRAIFRARIAPATLLVVLSACGSGPRATTPPTQSPSPARILPLARVIVLETAGPPPSDTSVSFTAGTSRIIVLRHGPPENIVFARVSFSAAAFGDSGQTVTVEIRPRPGVYGLELSTSMPVRSGVTIEFDYARFFSAPARARQVYGSDVAFERALAVGRLLGDGQIELLASISHELDEVSALAPGPGSYLVAAPQ